MSETNLRRRRLSLSVPRRRFGILVLAGTAACSGGEVASTAGGRLDGGAQPDAASGSVASTPVQVVPQTDCGGLAATGPRDSSTPSPADGRCGSSPRMIVSAATLPAPSDAGPLNVGVGAIAASPADLYYTVSVNQATAPGLESSYLAGTVLRVPLGGGTPTEVMSGYLFSKPVVTATSVILGGSGGVLPTLGSDIIASVPLSGGPPTTLVAFAADEGLVTSPATDGTFVYFGKQVPMGLDVQIQAVPLNPDAGAAAVTLAAGLPPDVVGAFGQELIVIYPQGETDSLPLPPQADSPVTPRGTCMPGSGHLMACGSSACWLAGTDTLERINPLAGPPTTVATLTGAVAEAFDVVFDGANFYVIGLDAAGSTQSLERLPMDGGCPVVLANMPAAGQGSVSVDDECVYWSNSEGIFSLAKTSVGLFEQ